jgi:HEAT repeat protein
MALPALERCLSDGEQDVRAAAILALQRQTHARATRLLQAVRDNQDEHLSLRVLAAASLLGPRPVCP